MRIPLQPISILIATLFTTSVYCGFDAQVIGILSQPSPYSKEGYPSTSYSYIAASYIKFIEAAGALVVPIKWDMPYDQLDALLDKLDGVLFPGGATELQDPSDRHNPSFYAQVGCHIMEKAFDYYNQGVYFPVWGTCLGFEMLTSCINGDFEDITRVYDSDNVAKVVNITQYGNEQSRLYAGFPDDLKADIQNQNLTFFHHIHTVDPVLFYLSENLASNVSITATTRDPKIGYYVASYEGLKVPFIGTQFHPEKNTYEWWDQENIPHDINAVRMEQYYAFHFINESKKCTHEFGSPEEYMEVSIYNYQPLHGFTASFDQVYIIPNWNATSTATPIVDEPSGWMSWFKFADPMMDIQIIQEQIVQRFRGRAA